jgi:CDP-glucose 4,6-dehydratase
VSIDNLRIFAGKKVLVTGNTGFKGSWLSLWLSELGAEVTGLALPPTIGQALAPTLTKAKLLHQFEGDIREIATVKRAFQETRPEFVFHLAAQALLRRSYERPQETFATNVLGSVNVLEAVKDCDSVKTLVYITSDKCYLNKEWHWGYRENDELGGPDPYSASKACAELALRAYSDSYFRHRPQFGAASTRAGNVIGGGDRSADRIVPDTIAAIEADKPVVLRSPLATRPWQHVLDPLYGYLSLAAALRRDPVAFSGPWNFGPGDRAIRTVDDLAHLITKAYGRGTVVHKIDPDAPHEANLLYLSSEKAHRLLGWAAHWDFERAATETAHWYRAVRNGGNPLEISRAQISAYMAEVSRGADYGQISQTAASTDRLMRRRHAHASA